VLWLGKESVWWCEWVERAIRLFFLGKISIVCLFEGFFSWMVSLIVL
jgi:hypothetical protein